MDRPEQAHPDARRFQSCISPDWPYLTVEPGMTQNVDAIYTDGVLKPTGELPLREKQRVRLTVETIDEPERIAKPRLSD